MSKSIVAIVGRPNVGKSTLFNRLSQSNKAIIDKEAGVTRDRIYQEIEWLSETFLLIDTGGIDVESKANINKQILIQTKIALEEADCIVFLVDGKQGLMPGDLTIANLIRKYNKSKIILAVNKIDSSKDEDNKYDFHKLGFDQMVSLSALQGNLGVGDLLDLIIKNIYPNHDFSPKKKKKKSDIESLYQEQELELNEEALALESQKDVINFCLIGKPNAGKSSLFNKLIRKERAIVDSESGTTRDSINYEIKHKNQKYCLVDTAGIRKKSKVGYSIEGFAVVRAIKSLSQCDVAVLVIDTTQLVSTQDQKIATKILENGKACVIVLNKWDLIEDKSIRTEMLQQISKDLRSIDYSRVLLCSALTGDKTAKIFDEVKIAYEASHRRVSTSSLNEVIHKAIVLNPPPALKRGKRFKVYYATQVSVQPPTFVLFVNDKQVLLPSYQTYLERKLREAFDFSGTPIRLYLRPKILKK